MSEVKIRWGILATGNIAAQFSADLKHSHYGELTGVASRDADKASAFCAKHGGTPSDYEALLARADIDAVYIALGQSDYLMHSKLTPWDTVPVDLTCRELGYHAGLAPDARRFGWQEKGVFLAASSPEQWHHMARYIWSGIR